MENSTHGEVQSDARATPPRTETERVLLELWSAALKNDRIGIYDDFLDVGGDSLSATLCINRIKERYAVELPLEMFFLEPAHIVELASQVDTLRGEQA
jgi:hypothetical protein